uniref:Uncharacterized protein n=1 Tax=uncultured marine thaumarchaeote KM3_72_A09 TaxID=1456261 RepID=A0A075HNH6_9ARCH|nr:hypothetical protein [uncultured marine thaumarchaeote KM3_72_A09]
MVHKYERRRGAAGASEENVRNIQRLASSLQRAVSTGRASRSQMRLIDRHLNRHLTTSVTNILHGLGSISSRTSNQSIKQRINEISLQLNEIVKMELEGYASLVNRDLSVDPIKIDMLVGVDEELSLGVAILEREVTRMNSKRILNVVGLTDLCEVAGEIGTSAKSRKAILAT